MKKTTQYILSAVTAFTIAGGGSILTVAGSGYELNDKTYIISIVIGLMAASKDFRSLMRMPPVEPGTDTSFVGKPQPTDKKEP